MIQADVALFQGLGHYYEGLSVLIAAQSQRDEAGGYKQAAVHFKKAVDQLNKARSAEKRLLDLAVRTSRNELFVRWQKVLNGDTEQLRSAMAKVAEKLSAGRYPAAECAELNSVLTRITAGFERNARIEGIPTFVTGVAAQTSTAGERALAAGERAGGQAFLRRESDSGEDSDWASKSRTFVAIIGAVIAMLLGLWLVFAHVKDKERGFDTNSLRALGLVLLMPTLILAFSVKAGINSQALAALLGTVAGYLLSRASEKEG